MNKLMLILIGVSACGQIPQSEENAQGNSQNPTTTVAPEYPTVNESTTTASTKEISTDKELASYEVTGNIDEAISAMAEQSSAESTGLGLVGASGSRKADLSKVCAVDGNNAVVTIAFDLDRSVELEGRVRSYSQSLQDQSSIVRTWSNANKAIACSEDGKSAEIVLADAEGTKLDVALERSRSRIASFENKASGKKIERSFAFQVQGSRSISWDQVTSSSEEIEVHKTITSDVSRKIQAKNSSGVDRLIESQVFVDSENPLKVVVKRDAESGTLIERSIVSGQVTAKRLDQGSIVTIFENVVYKPSGKCVATSGKISGSIYEAGSTEASVTFLIDFDSDSSVIKYSDGTTKEYTPEGCDIETIESSDA